MGVGYNLNRVVRREGLSEKGGLNKVQQRQEEEHETVGKVSEQEDQPVQPACLRNKTQRPVW